MIRRPPRSTPLYSSAASDVYKRQDKEDSWREIDRERERIYTSESALGKFVEALKNRIQLFVGRAVSYTHLQPTRHLRISYAVFWLKTTHTDPPDGPYPRYEELATVRLPHVFSSDVNSANVYR